MVPWICCQLGAREHYAIPARCFVVGTLTSLLTDAWFPPSSLVAKICGHNSKLAERFHDELSDAPVKAFNSSLILFEMFSRARGLSEWPKIHCAKPLVPTQSCVLPSLSTLNSQLRKGAWLPRSFTLSTRFYAATATPPLSRFATQRQTAGRRCSFRSILGPRKRGLWQKRRRACLNWLVAGNPRHLNIGVPGVRSASSPTELLLTPNGRVKGWFAEEFQPKRYQSFRWHTKPDVGSAAAHRAAATAEVSGSFYVGAAAARAISWSD